MINLSKKGHISELVGYSGIFLGSEIEALGSIKTEEDVFIDGEFKGSIETVGAVEIGKNSSLTGSITARSIIIEGFAKADLLATDSIHIAGCGKVQGSIDSKNISIDPGAVLKIKAATENV